LDEPRGDGDAFRIGAVEELQIFAKIFLVALAIKAIAAGSGIGDDDAVADFPLLGPPGGGDFGNGAGQFMAEGRGRGEHFGVVPTLEDFQVGPAGEGDGDLDADFARLEGLRHDLFDLNVFLSVENSGFHPVSIMPKRKMANPKTTGDNPVTARRS
jgi:hypothetical protein